MRHALGLTALCLVALLAAPLVAQDSALGTTGLASPNALDNGDVRVEIDWRYWERGNDTISGLIAYGISDRLDVGVTYVDFDNTGLPVVGGAPRRSELDGPGIHLKYVGRPVREGSWGWTVIPGVEILDMSGTNLPIGAFAADEETVFTLEVPIGIDAGDALVIISPKIADYPGTQMTGGPVGIILPATVKHFDTIFGIGCGIVAPLGSTGDWWIHGDVTPILAGDNSINEKTNMVRTQVPWSLGVRWEATFLTDESFIDFFITNTAGPTTATSLLGAPDGSVAFGGSASVEW